jgi:glycosyltransferase involved in cell wall biosynthesis
MSGSPEITVVIPAHNGGWVLRRAVEALRGQDAAPGRFEVVTVDDGSTDGSVEGLEEARGPVPVRVLRQPNRGRAAARNLGAAAARGRALLFLDADVWAAPGLVSAHLAHHAGGGLLGVQGRALAHPDSLTTVFMRATHLLPDLTVRNRKNLSPLHVITRNFSVTAEAFRMVGGFDEGFIGYGWEDIELGIRLRDAGVALRYEPTALAYHHHVQTLEGLMHKLRESGRGAVYFWRKHGRPASLGFFLEIHPGLLPLKWLVYRTGAFTRLVEAVLPWAERRSVLPLCSECYNHLLWRAYYEGVFDALRRPPGPEP